MHHVWHHSAQTADTTSTSAFFLIVLSSRLFLLALVLRVENGIPFTYDVNGER